MSFHHFRALMWKNLQLKKYHWFVSVLELVVPIGITAIFVLTLNNMNNAYEKRSKEEIRTNTSNEIEEPEMHAEGRSYLSLPIPVNLVVGYAPATPATINFMKGLLKDYDYLTEKDFKPLPNESLLEKFVAGQYEKDFYANQPYHGQEVLGLYFRNLVSNKTMPDKLSYVLRERHLGLPGHGEASQRAQIIVNERFIHYVDENLNKSKQLINTSAGVNFEKFPEQKTPPMNTIYVWFIFSIVAIAILIFSISFVGDILEERNGGVKFTRLLRKESEDIMLVDNCICAKKCKLYRESPKELIKITGVKEWMMWLCWFLYALPGTLISITVVVYLATSYWLITQIPFMVVWMFLVLYLMANVSLCILFSSLFQSGTSASVLYFFHYLGALLLVFYLTPYSLFVLSLLPFTIFLAAVPEIAFFEENAIDFDWSAFVTAHSKDLNASLLYFFFILIVLAILYFFLAYYIISINPGKYGIRKSPLFLFEGLIALYKRKMNPQDLTTPQPVTHLHPKYFEKPPSNSVKTIQVVDLHKHFSKTHAVRGANLSTYQGEITALLGHNGAGKTTTMAMLTGMTSPSSGSIYYRNLNIFEHMDEYRSKLGFCAQDSRLIPYLTVMQHLLFFGQLKRLPKKQAKAEAEEYLKMMDMFQNKVYNIKHLSGGQQRKLSLSIAMMGKAEILILDEPTSGMDTESRRAFWDVLISLRADRTMILSTHYMEEADALGNRIAIMNHGVIVCNGSSMFLKRAYETGYELTVSKTRDNSADITNLVQNALPDASVITDTASQIVYKLPLAETNKYPAMFKNLESSLDRLGIKHLGVTAAPMEQVFFVAGGATEYDPNPQESTTEHVEYVPLTSYWLYLQQFCTIFYKKLLFTIRDRSSIFFRIILPTILLYLILWMIYTKVDLFEEPLDISLSKFTGKTLLYQEADNKPVYELTQQMEKYVSETKNVLEKVSGSTYMHEFLVKLERESPKKFKSDYISAISVHPNNVTLWYPETTYSPHNLEITVDTFYNVLLRAFYPSGQYSIQMSSLPVLVNLEKEAEGCLGYLPNGGVMFIWFLVMCMFTTDLLTYFSQFISTERVDGFYHIQMMSRLSPLVYWLGTAVFDFILFFVSMFARILIYRMAGGIDFLNEFNDGFYAFLFISLLYGISGLLMIYTLNLLINVKDRSFIFFFFMNIFIAIISIIYMLIARYVSIQGISAYLVIPLFLTWIITIILPTCTFYFMFLGFMMIFIQNSQCLLCTKVHKPICLAKQNITPYFNFSSTDFSSSDGRFKLEALTIQMFLQILGYLIILCLVYSGLAGRFSNWIKKTLFGTKSTRFDGGDDDVQRERDEVREVSNVGLKKDTTISLLVNGLRKNYTKWFKNFTAVSDVSFMVERGKCFGLLGVNGAGKTTTFKMLTAEILPTLGDASIDDVKLSEDKRQYLSAIGYCSQTNCFIEQLTAVEMLNLIASLRGIRYKDRRSLVDKWISVVGLEEYKNRKCGDYSGGNKRKLCSAMALIGDPKVVFLDEPTTGVDPLARRNLQNVMAQSRASGQTVVLTSHSMEECETLCDRLTIMVSGVMKCIGTVQHLKKRYAQGFAAIFKVVSSPLVEAKIPHLQEDIAEIFKPSPVILKDSHSGLLYYQIADTTVAWSVLFQKMENIKQRNSTVVEDYVLSDTSLEQVFISLAKDAK